MKKSLQTLGLIGALMAGSVEAGKTKSGLYVIPDQGKAIQETRSELESKIAECIEKKPTSNYKAKPKPSIVQFHYNGLAEVRSYTIEASLFVESTEGNLTRSSLSLKKVTKTDQGESIIRITDLGLDGNLNDGIIVTPRPGEKDNESKMDIKDPTGEQVFGGNFDRWAEEFYRTYCTVATIT